MISLSPLEIKPKASFIAKGLGVWMRPLCLKRSWLRGQLQLKVGSETAATQEPCSYDFRQRNKENEGADVPSRLSLLLKASHLSCSAQPRRGKDPGKGDAWELQKGDDSFTERGNFSLIYSYPCQPVQHPQLYLTPHPAGSPTPGQHQSLGPQGSFMPTHGQRKQSVHVDVYDLRL